MRGQMPFCLVISYGRDLVINPSYDSAPRIVAQLINVLLRQTRAQQASPLRGNSSLGLNFYPVIPGAAFGGGAFAHWREVDKEKFS
jgi:hypothetical protein